MGNGLVNVIESPAPLVVFIEGKREFNSIICRTTIKKYVLYLCIRTPVLVRYRYLLFE
jgi:hypothetical protein